VAAITKAADIDFLTGQRDRYKLHTFTSARSELLFARRVLLVEGPGDATAIKLAAEAAKLDLDGEDLSVIECGSKSAIPFIAKVCSALAIPYGVLHDDDIWPVPEDDADKAADIEADNAAAAKLNAEIAAVADGSLGVFVMRPTLEAELGISRHAKDKPRRIAETLTTTPRADWPAELANAVAALTPK
jgi:hypothetical protein